MRTRCNWSSLVPVLLLALSTSAAGDVAGDYAVTGQLTGSGSYGGQGRIGALVSGRRSFRFQPSGAAAPVNAQAYVIGDRMFLSLTTSAGITGALGGGSGAQRFVVFLAPSGGGALGVTWYSGSTYRVARREIPTRPPCCAC